MRHRRSTSPLFTEGPHVLRSSPRGAGPPRRAVVRVAQGRRRVRTPRHRRVARHPPRSPALRRHRVPAPRSGPSPGSQGPPDRCRAAEKRGYVGSSMACPRCREAARFKGYRPKGLLSILGPLTIERGYYHCPSCHHGHCPGDAAFGLDHTDLTSGAAELATLAGALDSFAMAADVILPKMSGLSLAESTVERTAEAIGGEL